MKGPSFVECPLLARHGTRPLTHIMSNLNINTLGHCILELETSKFKEAKHSIESRETDNTSSLLSAKKGKLITTPGLRAGKWPSHAEPQSSFPSIAASSPSALPQAPAP